MTTYNTGNPIGSTDARDRLDNSENMDILENSTTLNAHPDRLGVMRKTRKGMELEHDNQIAAHEAEHDAQISAHELEHDNQMQSFENDFDSRLAGMAFTRVGTFTAGATLTDMRQTLLWEVSQGGDGHEYGWTGSFLPSGKVVAAGSTPATSGGVGAGAWVDRSDVTLMSEINIVQKRFACVADMIADTSLVVGQNVRTISYYSGWEATAERLPRGGNDYVVVATGTGVVDGGSFINTSNGLQLKGLFSNGHTIDMFGAKVNDPSASSINALAIGAELLLFSEARIPIGTYYSGPVSSSVVNSITRPKFTGLGFSNVNTSTNASIINLQNGDFYYGGTGADYVYSATDLVFVGGENYTSRVFGTDSASAAPYEHRCRYINVGFYKCLKAHYCDKYSSSSYLEGVTFHSVKYGFYPVLTCSNSKFIKCNTILCGTGIRARGYGINLANTQIGFGIPIDSGFGHARGLDLAGKVTVDTMYSEYYGGDKSDSVLMRLAFYDPAHCNIVLNNCEFQSELLTNDVEVSMEYNNAVWSWQKDWVIINGVSQERVPTFKVCANDAGVINTRLFKGVKVNGSDGLNYTSRSTTKVAYFNATDLTIDVNGSNTITYSSQTSNNITINTIQVDSSLIRYYTNFLNYSDASADKIYTNGYIFYGDNGWYRLCGDIQITTSLAVGTKWALACRYRNKSASYVSRIIASGVVLTGGLIDCSFSFLHEANGGAACFFGFVSSPSDYSCPGIADINASTTNMIINLKRVEGSTNVQS